MSKNLVVPTSELEELRSFAAYVEGFPVSEEWVENQHMIDLQYLFNFQLHWRWLGRSLDAYFSGRSDPLEESGLNDTFQKAIREDTNRYILLSILFFQGRKFLEEEARILGKNFPFIKRSDFLKGFALEDYRFGMLTLRQEHWESLTKKQHNERLREYQKLLKGEISEINETTLKRWAKENSKLHRDDTLSYKAIPWIYFCSVVFGKHRKELPAFKAYVETLEISKHEDFKKFTIIDGIFRTYPGRGRSKRSKSS